MRSDAEVAEAAARTATITLRLVDAHRKLAQARNIAAHLEAENHQLIEAAQRLIDNYVGTVCPEPDTCDCPLGHLIRATRP